MKLPATAAAAFATLMLLPLSAYAQSRPPQWYEVVTGIVAIPAAIIGLAYSYILIKKTRLEARKIELDIVEKEKAIREVVGEPSDKLQKILEPTRQNIVAVYLILRFIIIYLILTSWDLIDEIYHLIFGGAIMGAQSIWHLDLNGWQAIPLLLLEKLPSIGYWLIFFSLGWPLFKDTNSILGLNLRRVFRLSKD